MIGKKIEFLSCQTLKVGIVLDKIIDVDYDKDMSNVGFGRKSNYRQVTRYLVECDRKIITISPHDIKKIL